LSPFSQVHCRHHLVRRRRQVSPRRACPSPGSDAGRHDPFVCFTFSTQDTQEIIVYVGHVRKFVLQQMKVLLQDVLCIVVIVTPCF
jgi:hypothetical protein